MTDFLTKWVTVLLSLLFILIVLFYILLLLLFLCYSLNILSQSRRNTHIILDASENNTSILHGIVDVISVSSH